MRSLASDSYSNRLNGSIPPLCHRASDGGDYSPSANAAHVPVRFIPRHRRLCYTHAYYRACGGEVHGQRRRQGQDGRTACAGGGGVHPRRRALPKQAAGGGAHRLLPREGQPHLGRRRQRIYRLHPGLGSDDPRSRTSGRYPALCTTGSSGARSSCSPPT